MDYYKLLLSIVFLISSITDTFSAGNNERVGPLWYIQMGNRENMPSSSKGAVISYSGTESANYNPQLINGKMISCMTSQTIKNSLLPLVELQGHFYYFEKYFKTNYFKATQFCREHGMELLSIETNTENMEITAYLKKYYPKVEHFWTSGTDAGEEGAFVWLSTGSTLNFTNWGQGAPDNSGRIEHCLEILRQGVENYVWNDRSCNLDYNFICEVRE